jgi:hypothetical protein
VDLLQQVAPLFRVSFVALGEPPEGCSAQSAGLLVQLVVLVHLAAILAFYLAQSQDQPGFLHAFEEERE